MKICYQACRFSAGSLKIINRANQILAEYSERGIVVTLRQLYYQFVARDIIPNKQSEYKRLGSIINDARLAGLIDWDYLQDRTRNLNSLPHWTTPAGVIESAARSYQRDLWEGQENYVEVWVEKDALLSVIENICQRWDVAYFACRGYTSQSEMWSAGQRIVRQARAGRNTRVIHLGDHDPSGVDMSRDIEDRLEGFLTHHMIMDWVKVNPLGDRDEEMYREDLQCEVMPRVGERFQINRIALNMDQVRQYNPPPNPAKLTDSRATAYISEHGDESWELDALDPDVLTDLIEAAIRAYLDFDLWEAARQRQESERKILIKTSENWPGVSEYVESL